MNVCPSMTEHKHDVTSLCDLSGKVVSGSTDATIIIWNEERKPSAILRNVFSVAALCAQNNFIYAASGASGIINVIIYFYCLIMLLLLIFLYKHYLYIDLFLSIVC